MTMNRKDFFLKKYLSGFTEISGLLYDIAATIKCIGISYE